MCALSIDPDLIGVELRERAGNYAILPCGESEFKLGAGKLTLMYRWVIFKKRASMKKSIPLQAKKRHIKRKNAIQKSKGVVSLSVLLLLIIILFLFLSTMFVNGGIPSLIPQGQNQQMPAPTIVVNETGGGLRTITFDPAPTLASGSGQKCDLITNDIMLIVDVSGSMRGVKLEEAKIAASIFTDLISLNPQSRVGLVSFDKTAKLLQPLSNDFPTVKSSIDILTNGSSTCIQCGAKAANEQMASGQRPNVKRSAVLLSDGKGNHVDGKRNNQANGVALTEIINGNAAIGTTYYAIAFGDDADRSFMDEVANATGGSSYATPDEQQLTRAFSLVASDICQ